MDKRKTKKNKNTKQTNLVRKDEENKETRELAPSKDHSFH
jgi:hypothetical protein